MSSSETTAARIPQAPILYGIDPSITYKWVPLKFRKTFLTKAFQKAWNDAKLDEIPDEKEREIVIQRDFVEKYRGRQVAETGSPWVEVGPLSSALALRLEVANTIYQRQLTLAKDATQKEITAVEAKKIPKEKRDKLLREIQRRAEDSNVARGTSAYDPDLIQDVLAGAVRGWAGFVKPFATWEESCDVMPSEDQYELFWDIVNANAWTSVEFESFESAPALQQV